ncbi:MAG: hypothetical protein KDA60_00315 [Planctomycetales bacterium]|nr:hypothetical protein [Planctomycetales bacterium]
MATLTPRNRTGDVVVQRGRNKASQSGFCAIPSVLDIQPRGASLGSTVLITGTNFDANSRIRFGDGTIRPAFTGDPGQLRVSVGPEDHSGPITVFNECDGAIGTSAISFRVIPVNISAITFNQGLSYYGVVAEKPTLVRLFVTTPTAISKDDKLEVDAVEFRAVTEFGESYGFHQAFPNVQTLPHLSGLFSLNTDLAASFNYPSFFFDLDGETQFTATLFRSGHVVAQHTATVSVKQNQPLSVLFVPVMPSGASWADVDLMRTRVEFNMDDLRQRILPTGTIKTHWSSEVVFADSTFKLDSALNLYHYGHGLDRARRHWNDSHTASQDAQFVMGVVDPRLVEGTTPGYAFQNDVAGLLNVPLDAIDSWCDLADEVISLFGLSDGEGCSLDIPTNVGWVAGGPLAGNTESEFIKRISATVAHELGHILGLVKPYAFNGSLGDNISHSVNDEIAEDATCGEGDQVFDFRRTLYAQPGVGNRGPIVNPRRTFGGADPQLRLAFGSISSPHAKSIMSYACASYGDNAFFEPVDLANLLPSIFPGAQLFYDLDRAVAQAASDHVADSGQPARAGLPRGVERDAHSLLSKQPPGPRLHVSGTIDATLDVGSLEYLESTSADSRLTLDYPTDIWLVQLDAQGNELTRHGVLSGMATDDDDGERFFAATILRHDDLAQLELRRGDIVLDTRTAGSEPPSVIIVSPQEDEVFEAGEVLVEWIATDPEGDETSVYVEYSHDDGLSWLPLASDSGSGSVSVPVTVLPGGDGMSQIRITASDGLHHSVALSPPFHVAAQAPRVYIDDAEQGLNAIEGQWYVFSGGAIDNQDGVVNPENLQWYSDRSGYLGEGSQLVTKIGEVGYHLITLEATNSAGLTAVAQRILYVFGDYDQDGIHDDWELSQGLNILSSFDAGEDEDGDGLSLLVELINNLDATNPDTDGDGKPDGVELADGTNPFGEEASLPPDTLSLSRSGIDWTTDLAIGTPLPQETLGIFSRTTANWRVLSDVAWIEASQTSGVTPTQFMLRAQAYELPDGFHQGSLLFVSDELGVEVALPVTLTVIHRDFHYDFNRDGQLDGGDRSDLMASLGSSVGDELYDLRRDVNRDGTVDEGDLVQFDLVAGLLLPGDANLDGFVDVADFNIWNSHKFQTGTSWTQGDFNGDRQTDTSDFNIWLTHLFTSRGNSTAQASVHAPIPRAVAPMPVAEILTPIRRDRRDMLARRAGVDA